MNAIKLIILFLWLALVASLGHVSALTPDATGNRTWEKSSVVLETHQAEPLQTLGGLQESAVAPYDFAPDSLLAAKETAHFSGTDKPWTTGATPDSIYTHIDPKTGKAVQNAIYDSQGNVVGHVDFKNHGPGAASGHGHTFPQPGNPASGHGAGNPHIPNNQLPPGWDALPPGVQPRTPIGQ